MQNRLSPVSTPTLKRRLICLVYEVFLLTAVVALALFLFLFAMQKFSGPVIEIGRQVVIFVAAGAYFTHAWSGSGFTLAMKTWRIKLVKLGHAKVPFRTAALRYVLAWAWVAPALLASYALGLTGATQKGIALAIGFVAWGMTAFLDKDRQFLHDRLAGTRLISLPKLPSPSSPLQST